MKTVNESVMLSRGADRWSWEKEREYELLRDLGREMEWIQTAAIEIEKRMLKVRGRRCGAEL